MDPSWTASWQTIMCYGMETKSLPAWRCGRMELEDMRVTLETVTAEKKIFERKLATSKQTPRSTSRDVPQDSDTNPELEFEQILCGRHGEAQRRGRARVRASAWKP